MIWSEDKFTCALASPNSKAILAIQDLFSSKDFGFTLSFYLIYQKEFWHKMHNNQKFSFLYLDKLLLKSWDLCWTDHSIWLLFVSCLLPWNLLLLRAGNWSGVVGSLNRSVCCWFTCYRDRGTDLFVSSTRRTTPPWLVGIWGGGDGGLGGVLEEHRHDVVHRAHYVLLARLFLSYWQNTLLLNVKT